MNTPSNEEEYEVIVATNIAELSKSFDNITLIVGEAFTSADKANFTVAAGTYLCCKTLVSSDVGYHAVWNELYRRAIFEGYELSEQGHTVEYFRSAPEGKQFELEEIELQLPVDIVN